MNRSRISQEQIIAVLREHEAGAKAGDLARKHGFDQAAIGIVSEVFQHGIEFDAALFELALVKARIHCIARKAGEAVNDHGIDRLCRPAGLANHAPGLRPLVRRGIRAALLIGARQLPALSFTKGFDPPQLVRQGEIMLGLAGGGDTEVGGGMIRNGIYSFQSRFAGKLLYEMSRRMP